MLKRIFAKQINSITVAATLVAFSSLVSRFLGLFRDRVLASEIGAGNILDVYYAAFRIPDLVFNLLVLGALSAGFIPILTCLIRDPKCKEKTFFHKSPNKEAWELVSNILNVLGLILIGLSIVGFITAPGLMKLVAPGFDPEKQNLTVQLTRIMFLSPIFLGISSVFGGVLQSFKRFFIYSLAPVMYNIGIIIGVLFFVDYWGVYGLAWGVVLGAFLHMLIQVPVVFGLGFRYKLKFDLKNQNLRKIGRMMVPRTMSLAISQFNLLVITVIASGLAGGSLAVFNFANNLQSFPVGIFGISFAIAAFPAMSGVAFNKNKLVERFSFTVRQILFFIVPATVLFITLRAQIVRVILGAGKFGWTDTVLTFNSLGFFAISLFAQALIPLLIRVFYARHNSKTPFFVGLVALFVNVVFALYFSDLFGVTGLALAFSLSQIINFALLWFLLYFELGVMDEMKILVSSLKFSLAAFGCGLAVQIVKFNIEPFIEMKKFWGVLTQGLVAGISGILIYLLICYILRSDELLYFSNSLKRKLPWKKVRTGDQGEARGI